jgi:segregation and condensation protein B
MRRLTQAALETLAIVAYKQPVTKGEINAIRGVNSEATLQTLIEKGLVKEVGRKEGPGQPILYGTTRKFLEMVGVEDLSELPSWESFKDEKEE